MARLLDTLCEHAPRVRQWVDQALADRFPSTQMLLGPAGIGKALSVRAFAQELLCDTSPGVACGRCRTCLSIAADQYSELRSLRPEKQWISIEDCRETMQALSLRPLGRARVVCVDPVSALMPAAANALLKTLEEPPPQTYFFLLASSRGSLLPTLRSRAVVQPMRRLSPDDLLRLRPRAAAWVIGACEGSVGRLDELQSPAHLEARAVALQFLLDWAEEPSLGLVPFEKAEAWRKHHKDRSFSVLVAWHLMQILREVLKLRAGDSSALSRLLDDSVAGAGSDATSSRSPVSLKKQTERAGAPTLDPYAVRDRLLEVPARWWQQMVSMTLQLEAKLAANLDASLVMEELYLRPMEEV